MGIEIVKTTIHDGPVNLVVHCWLDSFTATLLWVATTDVEFLLIPEEEDFHRDWTKFGGLRNTAGTGIDGDISITTTGFASPDQGEITLWMRKS